MFKHINITQAVLIPLALLFTACSSDEPNSENKDEPAETRKKIVLSRAEKEIANQNAYFGIELLKAEASLNDKDAFVISPYSVSVVYSILANGVEGDAQAEILKAISGNETTVESINAFNSKIMNELPGLDNKVNFSTVNALCSNQNTTFNKTFAEIASTYYKAEQFKADLRKPEGVEILNRWAEKNSQGLIKNFLEKPIDSDFGMLNATYFKGEFNKKFNKANTKDEDFTSANGVTHKVKTMCDKQFVRFYESEDMTVTCLKFGNGAYKLKIIMPGNFENTSNVSMQQLLTSLTPAAWETACERLLVYSAELHLPRFTIEYKTEIIGALRQLGINTVFDTPEFNNGIISGNYGSLIKYSPAASYIKVDETGAEAAAVSFVGGGHGFRTG